MGTLSVFMSDLGKSLESAESGQLKTINQRLFYWQTGYDAAIKGVLVHQKVVIQNRSTITK